MDLSTGITVILGLSMFFALMYTLGLNQRIKRTVTCPETGTDADVELVQRYDSPNKAVRVQSCSLLPRPNHVDCGQECLKNLP